MKHTFLTLALLISSFVSALAYDFTAVCETGQELAYTINTDGRTVIVSKDSRGYGKLVIPASVVHATKTYEVTSIGDYAFGNCRDLTSVTIPESVTSIGRGAFRDCEGLTSVTILEGVTSIGDYAFDHCTGLTSVTIPKSVTSIGGNAFDYCTGLTSVTIPESVTSIGNDAFYRVKNIVYHGEATGSPWGALIVNGTTDGDFVYSDAEKTYLTAYIGNSGNVTIPEGVTSIGDYAFYKCTGLTSVTIPKSVTSIGGGAFSGCMGLTSVTIPESVTSIGIYAFSDCMSLTSVTIPKSVTSIGGAAFSGCMGLTSVTIPGSVTSIGGGAFYKCTGLTSVTILEGVTSIGGNAFSGCKGLTSVTIPKSVTSIGAYAFFMCEGLTSVTILEGVTSIGEFAFFMCTGLTSVTIPESVTSIGGSAFSRIKNIVYHGEATGSPWGALTVNGTIDGDFIYSDAEKTNLTAYIGKDNNVVISESVTSIGDYAFYRTSITSVIVTSLSPPYWIGGLSNNTLLYVPNEALEAYRNTYPWANFKIESSTAEKVELTEDEVLVEPEAEKASLSFPIVESADSYLLTIYENDEINSTFTFNEQGQLTNIDASLKSGSIQGFLFTVTGLSAGTEYSYLLQALDANQNVLKEYSGSFTTQDKPLEIDCVSNEIAVTIVNRQILVNGEAPAFVVTVSGQKIKNANLKTGMYFVVVDGNSVKVVVR